MTINEYQEKAMTTCMASCDNFGYMSYGLVGEVGELMGKIAKHIRKENISIDSNQLIDNDEKLSRADIELMVSELGDIQWFVAGLAQILGYSLEEVCQWNLDKLQSRKQRNKIDGDGDNR